MNNDNYNTKTFFFIKFSNDENERVVLLLKIILQTILKKKHVKTHTLKVVIKTVVF